MNKQNSSGVNPNDSINNGQRNKKSLRFILYAENKIVCTPDIISGLGDYQCPLQKTLMPNTKKGAFQSSKDTQKD